MGEKKEATCEVQTTLIVEKNTAGELGFKYKGLGSDANLLLWVNNMRQRIHLSEKHTLTSLILTPQDMTMLSSVLSVTEENLKNHIQNELGLR
jgi:hypothetical protein